MPLVYGHVEFKKISPCFHILRSFNQQLLEAEIRRGILPCQKVLRFKWLKISAIARILKEQLDEAEKEKFMRAPKARAARGVGGHAPPQNFYF